MSENKDEARLSAAMLGEVHPCEEPNGWQEFEVTLAFYVTSDDPHIIERERRRVFALLPDVVLNALEVHMSDLGESSLAEGVPVRVLTGDFAGKVGVIGRRAHPVSPWTWVVYSPKGERPFWGTAVNDEDVERVDA